LNRRLAITIKSEAFLYDALLINQNTDWAEIVDKLDAKLP
jgi:hypothetical protein